MKHFIVNIGCEYGSGGPDIGRMVAESLGIPFYDRDLVDQVVEKLGVDRDLVEKADSGEENVKYEFDTTFGPRYANLTNRVIYTQFEVIHKLAAKSSCVIIGRCSNYILKDRDDCLNIFVYAPDEFKVKHIMEQKGISQKEAQKLVKYNDGMLKSRYEYMTNSDMRDCRTRHMMIDSSIPEIIYSAISPIIGVYSLNLGLEGFKDFPIPLWQRVLLVAGALALIVPGIVTDLIGLLIVAFVIFNQKRLGKKVIA